MSLDMFNLYDLMNQVISGMDMNAVKETVMNMIK